jgi:S-formylglutathione hydrolase FrmB
MSTKGWVAALFVSGIASAVAQEGPPAQGQPPQGQSQGQSQGQPPGPPPQGGGRRFGRPPERDPASVALAQLSYQRVDIESRSLKAGKGSIGLYLPIDYAAPANEKRHYPLVLWLHGLSEDDRDFHFGGARVVDGQIAAGKLAQCILVAVSAPRASLYMNGEPAGDVRDYVTKDIPNWVAANHRVSTERGDLALMGVSLGGMAALRYGLSEPDRFATVATHSAATFPDDPANLPEPHRGTVERFGERMGWHAILGHPIDPEKFAAVNPTSLALRTSEIGSLRLYFDAGTADRYGFGPANEELAKVMKERKLPHTFRLIEGGEHSWGGGTIQTAMVLSLAFVDAGFSKRSAAQRVKPVGG